MTIRENVVNLTKELVSFKTTSDNEKELDKCAKFIEEYFKKDKLYITRYDFKGVPSLFIATKKTEHPKVIINAHFDVVPAEDEMFTTREENNMLFGRGVIDDKGPMAVGMLLMKELASRKNRPDIALLLTGDEEIGGRHGAKYVLGEVGIRSDFCIVLDGGEPNAYVTKAKGILRARFIATGTEAHASRPWLGDNAIEKLLKIYPKLKKLFKDKENSEWFTTMNLSTFHGGDAENKVPGEAEMLLDIRFTNLNEIEEILEEMRKIARQDDNVKFKTKRTPIFTTNKEDPFVQELAKISEEVFGEKAKLIKESGGTDGRYFSVANIPTLVTKPHGGGLHSPTEYLDLKNIEELYTTLKKFLIKVG